MEREKEEIEITPEMIAAGSAVIASFDRRVADERDLAEWVYEAMVRAKSRRCSS